MSFLTQINSLLVKRAVSVEDLSALLGIARASLRATLAGKREPRSSTLHALAAGLDAEWTLVPREHLLEVHQVLKGKGTGPDYSAPSAADLYLRELARRGQL
ncbi:MULTISPECIES: transcriptional regulator [Paraburkholderia]|uniref:transcriptional regulator n=1 Tax=Paraburkholderia TaxID=1822464 RepID=UPI0038B867EF